MLLLAADRRVPCLLLVPGCCLALPNCCFCARASVRLCWTVSADAGPAALVWSRCCATTSARRTIPAASRGGGEMGPVAWSLMVLCRAPGSAWDPVEGARPARGAVFLFCGLGSGPPPACGEAVARSCAFALPLLFTGLSSEASSSCSLTALSARSCSWCSWCFPLPVRAGTAMQSAAPGVEIWEGPGQLVAPAAGKRDGASVGLWRSWRRPAAELLAGTSEGCGAACARGAHAAASVGVATWLGDCL